MSAEQQPWTRQQYADEGTGPAADEAIRRVWPMASPKSIDALTRAVSVVRTTRGPLMSEGEQPSRVALVVSGTIAATWSAPDGRTVFAGLYGPGQFLGIATLAGAHMTVGVDALTAVTLLTWDSRRFRGIADADAALAANMLDRAVFAVHALTHLGKVRTFTTARSRLAGLLIKYEPLCFAKDSATVPRTQLGALAGVSARMVNTILRDWEATGVVERVGVSGLVLLDRDALAAEAAPLDFPAPDATAPGAWAEPVA